MTEKDLRDKLAELFSEYYEANNAMVVSVGADYLRYNTGALHDVRITIETEGYVFKNDQITKG